MTTKPILFFCLIGFLNLNAQSWFELLQRPDANLYDIQQSFESYWQTHDKSEKGKGYKAFRRFEHFAEPRVFPSGKLSQLHLTESHFQEWQNEQILLKPLGQSALVASATWTAVGPMGAISGNAGAQLLKRILKLNTQVMLGIGGILTFKQSHLRETVKNLGINNLVLETDAPYLAPTPFRGKRNAPPYLFETLRVLSQVLELDSETVMQKTTQNARLIFNTLPI